MIRIKDYIFNENEIEQLQEISNFTDDEEVVHEKVLQVCRKTKSDFYMLDTTFEDIEWNYENNNEYCNVFYEDRIKELKEKNKTFEDYNKDLNNQLDKLEERIDKAIEYIEKNKQIFMFADLRKDGTHQYTIECDADDLIKILKGEENESN